MTTAVHTVSIEELVAGLRQYPEAAFDGTETIRRFLQQTPVSAESLTSYLCWSPQHYTRNLIDRTPLYELMAICWEVGQASSIHNHHNQNCWMAVPMGRLHVENYRTLHQDLGAGKCKIEPFEILEMNISQPCAVDPKEPVHRVINPREFNQRAISLHVYSRPFDRCVVYSAEKGTCGEIQLHFNTKYGKQED